MSNMVTSPAYPALTPQIWDDQFFVEYVRQSKFSRYMGTDEGAMFQVKEDLTVKAGNKVTFAKIGKLTGAGVTGTAVLEGQEEVLDQHAMAIQIGNFRHAVAVTDWDEELTPIDLRNAAKKALKVWELEKMKNDLTSGLLQAGLTNDSNGVPQPTPFGTATSTMRNTWMVNNQDRVLVGSAVGNYNATFATAILNVDGTSDMLSPGVVSLAKRIAQSCSPVIRPIATEGDDEEWYVMWAHPLCFRDLKVNAQLVAAQSQALPRAEKSILFTGGDLVWDGVIIKELWEAAGTGGTLTGMGAAGINVGVNVLAGAQAVGLAWGRRMKSTTNVRDYGFRNGVGIQEARGIQKLQFGRHGTGNDAAPCDNGTVTVFCSAVPDA